MNIQIPKTFMGKPIEGAMNRVLAGTPKDEDTPIEKNRTYEVPANEKRNYIQVPQFGIIIATRETHLGKNMFDTLEALAGERLKMPSQRQFIQHWLNVKESAEGKRPLFYADGSVVPKRVAKDLWNYMSSTDRSPWGGKICWTWLNSLFKEERGKWTVEEDLRVLQNARGEKYLNGTGLNLDSFLGEDCYANLNFNAQNLPATKSATQSYSQGNNLRFWHPKNGRVAGFLADSVWAYLVCGRYPAITYTSLGVFSCAEGAGAQKNSVGGKK